MVRLCGSIPLPGQHSFMTTIYSSHSKTDRPRREARVVFLLKTMQIVGEPEKMCKLQPKRINNFYT